MYVELREKLVFVFATAQGQHSWVGREGLAQCGMLGIIVCQACRRPKGRVWPCAERERLRVEGSGVGIGSWGHGRREVQKRSLTVSRVVRDHDARLRGGEPSPTTIFRELHGSKFSGFLGRIATSRISQCEDTGSLLGF